MEPLEYAQSMDEEQSKRQVFAYMFAATTALIISAILILPIYTADERFEPINLKSKINPNIAEAASLMRLPRIGRTRAAAIVAYREENTGIGAVFESVEDLEKIRGIGSKTANQMSEHLCFE